MKKRRKKRKKEKRTSQKSSRTITKRQTMTLLSSRYKRSWRARSMRIVTSARRSRKRSRSGRLPNRTYVSVLVVCNAYS